MQSLSSSLQMGPVALLVRNKDVLTDFYTQVIGLEIIAETPEKVILGWQKKPLLILKHQPQLGSRSPQHAGLYHLALLFSSRQALAVTLYRVLRQTPQLFSGSADHLVSEAFYLTDPEGNGIELYYDRDPELWKWQDGQVQMASLYLDPRLFIETHLNGADKNSVQHEKKIGHVHLKVGNIEDAEQFYVNDLGFDITARLPSALFISVNGYHHHLGMNTWESKGASGQPESLGLGSFSILLPSKFELEKLENKLLENQIEIKNKTENSFTINDPWNNQIVIEAAGQESK